jgi:hypothetical protein
LVGKLQQDFLQQNAELIDDLARLLMGYVDPSKQKPGPNSGSTEQASAVGS